MSGNCVRIISESMRVFMRDVKRVYRDIEGDSIFVNKGYRADKKFIRETPPARSISKFAFLIPFSNIPL